MHTPTLSEFLKLATQGNLIPVTRRILLLSLSSFALLIMVGFAAIYLANRAAQAEGWIVHTMNVRRGARALLVELLNAETSARGQACCGEASREARPQTSSGKGKGR